MKKYKILRNVIWVLTILWMALIFYFSHQPAEISRVQSGELLAKMNVISEDEVSVTGDRRIFNLQKMIRKSAHFIEYFGLGFLMTLSIIMLKLEKFLKSENWELRAGNFFVSWLICTIYGATDELHQYFIPGRGAMLKDVYLDSISSLTGVVFTGIVILLINKFILKLKRIDLKTTTTNH